jgi:hypothetical protein
MRRIILCTEGVNVYGYRVLVGGADLKLFTKNPVMLWMHIRGKIIGKWKDVKIEDGKITAEPVFADTDEGRHYKKLYEDDMINMASIWVQPLEWSEDPKLRLEGQTAPTVTEWVLKEGSLVDIAGDTDAIKLVDSKNNEFKLSDFNKNNLPKQNDMKKIALFLKLSDSASEDAILEAVQQVHNERADLAQKLADKTAEVATLASEKKALADSIKERESADFEQLLNAPEKKLTEAQKATYKKLFEKDKELATEAVKALPTFQHLSDGAAAPADDSKKDWSFDDYSRRDPKALESLKLNDKEAYKALFKKQYGVEPKV